MSGCDEKAKTEVEIMWTNQHGTGPKTDDRVESQIILQYMCQPYPKGKMTTSNVFSEFEYHTIRNGQRLSTQRFVNSARENSFIRKDFGIHEPLNYFQAYFRRERNKGEKQLCGPFCFHDTYFKEGCFGYEELSINRSHNFVVTQTKHCIVIIVASMPNCKCSGNYPRVVFDWCSALFLIAYF